MSALSQRPGWIYLLRDYLDLYRSGSAGGSAKIRSHQRLVSRKLAKILANDPPFADLEPMQLPVCVHLQRAIDNAENQTTAVITRSVRAVRESLKWQYGYEKVPKGLEKKYAYAEALGPNGPIFSDELILGLVLFAPKTTYPAHNHKGITESYICLSGSISENDVGVYSPGSLILNPPGQMHRITTADREPCLLAYAWSGSREDLVSQKMVFSKPRRKS
jgi:dimethylpropiothetin dethiomethylase